MSNDSLVVSQSSLVGNLLSRRSYSDVAMVIGVIAIIVLMVLPLSTAVIDGLVAINISVGMALLLIALYIPSPVAFSSFPSVLLLVTLFRLSLGIATTRMILLQADAGQIIHTFGKLGAGGNLIVGVVVFVIITIVQFIVIAKGAERVAEVAARFTLDAMPGKQLSIDSDLRSGMLDRDEARKRRRSLEIESQLYGSLDGAMKFVKGDSIAGIIIIVVNLLGGLGVGVLQNGLSFSDAVETYSILTIGDGLVSQIPALLAAIAAGLVVTRTGSDTQDRHLGEAVGRQFLAQPRVLLITGLIAGLLAWIPGFPKIVFLLVAAGLVTVALRLMPGTAARLQRTLLRQPEPVEPPSPSRTLASLADEYLPVAPVLVELSPDDVAILASPTLTQGLARARERLFQTLGVPSPSIDLRSTGRVAPRTFRIALFDVPAASGEFPDGGDAAALLVERLEELLFVQAAQFIGIQEVNGMLSRMSKDYPDLVKEVYRVVALQRVTDVLRRLVDEQVSIRNLRDILESLADQGQREKDPTILAEHARASLRRYLSERYGGPERELNAVLLHPELEEYIRGSLRTPAGPTASIALDPGLVRPLCQELQAFREAGKSGQLPRWVIMTQLDLRRPLRRLLETDFNDVVVLSREELSSDVRVRRVGYLGTSIANRTP